MKAIKDQILNRFRKKRPEVDLSFLNEFDEEEAEEARPSEEVEPALGGGDAGAGTT